MLEKSVFNLRRIYLVLGTACNFNCVYCIQHENKPRCKKQISPTVFAWLENIAETLPEVFKPELVFYGGEPLLYKEAIHQIVDRFKDAFRYSIISNGSYLTDEDVKYFNQNNITYVFSNDGPNTVITRQIDMWQDDEFVSRFNKLNNRVVDSVYSAQNQETYKLFKYIEDKSPGTQVCLEDLICNSSTPSYLVDFNQETLLCDYKKMGDEVEKYFNGECSTTSQCATKFTQWLREAMDAIKTPDYPLFGRCGSGKSNLSIDTEGNVYLCKNFNEKIGTVLDSYDVLYENAKALTKTLRDKNLEAKGCFECPAFYFCRGGCPFEEPSELQKKKCEMVRTKWASVVSFIDNKLEVVENESTSIQSE